MLASGFGNAALTRTLMTAVVILSVLASITDTKYYLWIAIEPHLLVHRQFWRLLTWQLCYTNSTEVLFAAMTIYQLRVIERLWGTRKLASFLVFTLPYTCLLPPLLMAFVRPLTGNRLNYIPAGPTAIIFALMAQYHAAIPYAYKYQVSATETSSPSLMLTSKSTSYLLPAQLALSQFPGSTIAALIGWAIGKAYRRDILPGGASRWRLPDLLGKSAERERYAGLRRRMEGDAATASGVASSTDTGARQRRGFARAIFDQFRGAS